MNHTATLSPTETRNPSSANFDQLSTIEMVRLMNQSDALVPLAVAAVLPQIAQAVDWTVAALENGGRLFTMGAGTSGRLAVLDAVELLPTFSLPPGQVIPLLAGGTEAMFHSIEGMEDDPEQGRADLAAHDFHARDLLLTVAASGRTPYALGGLAYAKELKAKSIALVCNNESAMAAAADCAIEVVVGPEVLTGSTRLKAGTSQKMVLNMISTCAMAKRGKVFGNLMVDVRPSNEKLRLRAVRIVREATGREKAVAQGLLEEAQWDVKTAVVMGLMGVDAAAARARLDNANGYVRAAIDSGN